MAIDFPAGDPNLPDAAPTGESLETMHGGLGHPAATTRLLANIKALGAKLGYGTSLPGAVAGVLRRTASGQSGWGQTQAGDYGAGSIANADVGAGAGLAVTKLALLPNGTVLKGAGGANVAAQVLNADVGAAAALDLTKLALLGNGNVLKGAGGANTAAQLTDADVAAGAAIAKSKLAALAIADADVAAGAAIGLAKLAHVGSGNVLKSTGTANTGGQIVNADVAAGAAIAYSKLSLANQIQSNDILNGSLVDADFHAAAGIALTKLAAGAAGVLKSNGAAISAGNQILTADIAAGAVSQSTAGAILAGGTYVNSSGQCVMSSQCQLTTTGGPVLVLAYLCVYETTAGGTGQIFSTTLTIDGGGFTYTQSVTAPGVSYSTPVAIMGLINPSAGLHTFGLSVGVTNNFVWTISAGQIIAVEFKR